MALATYSDLKASVASTLHRTDLTTQIPDFVTLAEAQMRRRLRTAKMVTRTTLSVNAQYVDAPSDFDGIKTLDLATDPVTPLKFLSDDMMTEELARNPGTGKPRFFSIVGVQFRFLPVPDTTYTADLGYYQNVPALSDSATTNWVLTGHPDAYLYGTLLQAALWLRDDARAGTWSGLFETAVNDITAQDERANYGLPLTMRRRSFG